MCSSDLYRFGLGWAQRALGRIALAGGRSAEAAEHLAQAVQTFGSMRARFELARTQLDLARALHAQGDGKAAATTLRSADEQFRSLKISRYVARSEWLARKLRIELER